VADSTTTLTVSGNGDVLEPHDGVMAIGETCVRKKDAVQSEVAEMCSALEVPRESDGYGPC
jgi:ATP-dependent protease HslVU (ClpYQ) peptidase subunit